jgi:hypothetical protein
MLEVPTRRLGTAARLLVLLVVPLLLIGPSLLPGKRFLPQAPVMFEPLRSEHPEAALAAERGSNRYTGDRLFPVLTDQLELRRRLFAGESPAVEEKLGLGVPLLGNAIHGPFLPQNLLAVLVPPDLAAGWLALASLVLAGAGAWAFLARRGLDELACGAAALCFQGTGFGVVNLHYPMKVDAALWLPWCLWALDGWRRGDRRGGPFLALAAAASLLSGFPPIAGFVLAAVVCTAVALGAGELARGTNAGAVLRRLAATGAALLLGLSLAAVQLAPTADAALASPRGAATAAGVAAHTLPLVALPLAAVPDPFMDPQRDPAPRSALAAYLADREDVDVALGANGLEWNSHAGAAVFTLAVVGLFAGASALLPLALLALAFGWAQGWPGFEVLYHLPALNGGLPTRALAVAWFAWVWLAALGLDHVLRAARGRRVALAGVAASCALVALVVAHAALPSVAEVESTLAARHDRDLAAVRELLPSAWTEAALAHLRSRIDLFAVAALGVALALGLTLLRRRGRTAAGLALALVLGFELLATSRHHLAPRDLGGLPVFPPSPAIEAITRAAGDGRVVRVVPGGAFEATGLARPNMLMAYGVADLSAYVAFNPRDTARWFEAIDPRCTLAGGVLGLPDEVLLDDPRLDAAGVTCVLSRTPLHHPRLVLEHDAPEFHVYRRRNDLAPSQWLAEAPPPSGALGTRARAERALALGVALSLAALVALAVWITRLARASREARAAHTEVA